MGHFDMCWMLFKYGVSSAASVVVVIIIFSIELNLGDWNYTQTDTHRNYVASV